MRAVVRFIDTKKGGAIVDVPVPKPIPEHILIKVMASPINPADELYFLGMHGEVTKEPAVCGMEGAGSVLEIGAGVPKEFTNKKVVFFKLLKETPEQVGCWGKFALVHYQNCFIIDDSMKYEEVCGSLINPLTCYGMIEIVKKKKQQAIIHNAAASGVGKVLLGMCLKEKIECICVVRKKEHVDLLKSLGATYVFDYTQPTFDEELAAACVKLNCHICFDPVGGELTNKILKALPPKSAIYMYGALAGEIKSLNQGFLIFKNIKIKNYQIFRAGFYGNYEKTKEIFKEILEDLRAGGKIFKTIVAKTFKIPEFKEAMEKYKELATKGKCVFLPQAFP